MVTKKTGFSLDLLIHPGETLIEVLEDRNMTQKELALRTGVSPKHISKVVNGSAAITAEFAAKLEYALNIEACFWMNLQSQYDLEKATCEDQQNISNEEIDIAKQLKDIWNYLVKINLVKPIRLYADRVIELRKLLDVSNLTAIPRLQHTAIYRKASHVSINPYVLFAWQKLCLMTVSESSISNTLDLEKLKSYLPQIKRLMFVDINVAIKNLKQLLGECGVNFTVIQNFRGAPVQGYIEKLSNDTLLLCLTIRGKFADIFWFSLFHEIAHILHEDFESGYIDYDFEKNEIEENADKFASNVLIESNSYNHFVSNNDFTLQAIKSLAKNNNVPNYIVIGRLQKEERLAWTAFADQKVKYDWK